MPGAVWAIVVAAGSGQRFGRPKQYEALGGGTVLERSLAVARQVADAVVAVVPPGMAGAPGEVEGGATRSESVRRGLAVVDADAEVIVVHDGARPFASPALFRAVIDAVVRGGIDGGIDGGMHGEVDGAVPGLAVSDTIKIVDETMTVVETPERARLVAIQTPQAFRADALRAAHALAPEGTDDAALVEAAGGRVVVVPGEPDNRKLTVPADLEWARRRVATTEGER